MGKSERFPMSIGNISWEMMAGLQSSARLMYRSWNTVEQFQMIPAASLDDSASGSDQSGSTNWTAKTPQERSCKFATITYSNAQGLGCGTSCGVADFNYRQPKKPEPLSHNDLLAILHQDGYTAKIGMVHVRQEGSPRVPKN